MTIARRTWLDLTKREARDVFDHHVATHATRVKRAVEYLQCVGVPSTELDFSRHSLDIIWPAVVAAAPAIPSEPHEYGSESELAQWARFRLGFAERIGPELSETVTLVAAYFSECVLRAHDGNGWGIANDKGGADFRQTQLVFHTGPTMSAENLVSKVLIDAIEGEGANAERNRAPDGLRRHFDVRMHIEPDHPLDGQDGTSSRAFEVAVLAPNEYHVTVNAEVDNVLDQRIDLLIERLRGIGAIAQAHREDRDVILVTTTSPVPATELESLIENEFASAT